MHNYRHVGRKGIQYKEFPNTFTLKWEKKLLIVRGTACWKTQGFVLKKREHKSLGFIKFSAVPATRRVGGAAVADRLYQPPSWRGGRLRDAQRLPEAWGRSSPARRLLWEKVIAPDSGEPDA